MFPSLKCKTILCHFFPIFFFPTLLLIAVTYWAYHEENQHDQQLLKQQQLHDLRLLKNHFQQEILAVITDLHFLAEQNELKTLITSPASDSQLANLAEEYRVFSQYKEKYDQTRYIDKMGQERVRINLQQGIATIVPEQQLQNKFNRYYFKETNKLKKGEIYISKFDLNIENNQIETPIKPVIRLATPIYNQLDQFTGIVILNYLGQKLLNSLHMPPNSLSHHLLINKQGYWLRGLTPSDEWGHMYADRQENKIANDFPAAWQIIKQHKQGQFHNPSGLFSYSNFDPLETLNSSKSIASQLSWKLISYIPQHIFDAHAAKQRQSFIIFDLVMIIFWFISCLFLTGHKYQRDQALSQIIERDEQLLNIFETAFDSVITINQRGIIETFNPAASRMFGYQEQEILGNKVNILMGSPHREFHDTYLQRFIDSEQPKIIGKPTRVKALHKNGQEFSIDICIGAKKIKGEWVFTGIIRDAAALIELEQEVSCLRTHDSLLSNCYNRRHFQQLVQQSCNEALLTNEELALILIKIDHLDAINRQYGYQATDDYLVQLAQQLSELIAEVGSLARYSHNLFAIMLPGCSANETAQNTFEIIEEIQQFAISQHPKLQIHQQYSYINLQQPDLITAEALFLKLEENLQ